GEIERHNDSGQVASVSEPTLVVVIESRINKLSSMLALLIPWMAIEPVAVRISGRQPIDPTGQHGGTKIHRAMSKVPVTMRAEVASIDLPVSQILSLTPGSVISLG